MYEYGDVIEGKPSRIYDPVPDLVRGRIITAVNNDPEMLAKGRVEIQATDGKRYWMDGDSVKLLVPKNPSYPEHEKFDKVKEQSQAIGEFLIWATSDKGFSFGQDIPVNDEESVFRHASEGKLQDLLMEFFSIDRDKWYAEKNLMYKRMQITQGL